MTSVRQSLPSCHSTTPLTTHLPPFYSAKVGINGCQLRFIYIPVVLGVRYLTINTAKIVNGINSTSMVGNEYYDYYT